MRRLGTQARGIRTPIIQEGDNLEEIVVSSLLDSARQEGFSFQDKDVVGITESVVARAQGNYITIDDIAAEINDNYQKEIGVVFPILSRNRFAMILQGIARSGCKIYLQLSYPRDEVGNPVLDPEKMREAGIKPYEDKITREKYKKIFPDFKHPYTGINYLDLYQEVGGENLEVFLANNPEKILDYTGDVLVADIHSRHTTRSILQQAGARKLLALDELCTRDKGEGYNPEYGLLGSNKATEEKLKLFPRQGQELVERIQARLKEETGSSIEVLIYGDGAYKDPTAQIWELADPVVSPAFTSGLAGTPNEIKLKYLADNKLKGLEGDELLEAAREEIAGKDADLVGKMEAQGTTPRQLTDLLGSLCDLVSGSGDKGTPVILIQGYFDSLADD